MKRFLFNFLMFSVFIGGPLQSVAFAEKAENYIVFRYGNYSPSSEYDVNNINIDNDNGFDAEIAVGHYYSPVFALELASGYFESEGKPPVSGKTTLEVVPILLTAKAFLPMGPLVEPYGAFGIGYYLTELKVSGFGATFSSDREDVIGLHAGAGVNVNVAQNVFLGVEGRYFWAEPELGGEDIELDGFIISGNLGFRF